MGLLLKLHLSSYVARNTQDFSITTNVIVLFLLRVMKDVILICLMSTLPQFMFFYLLQLFKIYRAISIYVCFEVPRYFKVHIPVITILRWVSAWKAI